MLAGIALRLGRGLTGQLVEATNIYWELRRIIIVEIMLYIALLLVPLFVVPYSPVAKTTDKRALLYVLAGMACLCWIWGSDGRIHFSHIDIWVLLFGLFCLVSITWTGQKEVAMREVIQLGAFIAVYFMAKQADIMTVVIILASVGILAFIPSYWITRYKLYGQMGIFYKSIKDLRWRKTFWPIGNISNAGCVFMVGMLCSIYLVIQGIQFAWFLILGNLVGLLICGSRATYLGAFAGIYIYALQYQYY